MWTNVLFLKMFHGLCNISSSDIIRYMHKQSELKITSIILLASVLAGSLLFATQIPSTYAADETDEEIISDHKKELEKLKEKEAKYRNLIELKKKQKDVINTQVANLEQQSKSLEGNIATNEEQITALLTDIRNIKNQIIAKNQKITTQKKLLSSLIRSHYDTLRHSAQVDNIFPGDKAKFTLSSNQSQLTERLSELTDLIVNEKKTLQKDQESLDNKRKEVEDLQDELKQENIAIENTKNSKVLTGLETQKEQQKYKERLEDVLEEQLEIQQEIDSLATTYIGTFAKSDLPSKKKADLSRPVKNPYIVTQGYGRTSFSHHYKGGNHNGVDYSGRGNRTVLSTGDGEVIAVGNMGRYGYGRWIAINHENGLISLYGHLSIQDVSRGDKVEGGDKIGTMGNTGFSTATHLHFTLFVASTFKIVNSSSVSGIRIPTGATVNPALYY